MATLVPESYCSPSVLLLPLLANLLAVITGIRAVGDGRAWRFTCKDVVQGKRIAMIYLWVIGSTCFSLVHFVALLTQAPIIQNEQGSLLWVAMHTLNGLFFTAAHLFVDAVFEDKYLLKRFLGLTT